MSVENVLLITIDSLRYDYRPEDAPALEDLANNNVSFENAFATGPGTTPSFPALLTGSLPLSYDGLGKMSDDRPFLAAELRSRGLSTAGFHSNPFLSQSFNYDSGFDTFEDYQDSLTDFATKLFPQGIEKSAVPTPVTSALKRVYELVSGQSRPYESAETVTDDALDWLGSAPDGFFEWVHYMDVHHPCDPPVEYLAEFDLSRVSPSDIASIYSKAIEMPKDISEEEHDILINSYRASLRYVDDQINRLLTELRSQGRFDDTLIIVTSDHGQLFGEEDSYGKPYRLLDSLIRVPLIVTQAPNRVADATDELVSLVDVPPLIDEVLGIEPSEAYKGSSPAADASRRHVLAEHQMDEEVIVGARSADEKYVIDDFEDCERAYTIDDEEELPAEINSVASELCERAVERINEIDVERPEYVSEIDAATEQRLEDLGYL